MRRPAKARLCENIRGFNSLFLRLTGTLGMTWACKAHYGGSSPPLVLEDTAKWLATGLESPGACERGRSIRLSSARMSNLTSGLI